MYGLPCLKAELFNININIFLLSIFTDYDKFFALLIDFIIIIYLLIFNKFSVKIRFYIFFTSALTNLKKNGSRDFR